jgi:hypothetical protein
MTRTVRATFDGEVLRPEEPLPIEPNTSVQITVEVPEESPAQAYSFLRKARSLDLESPPDWSERLEDHLYGKSSSSSSSD